MAEDIAPELAKKIRQYAAEFGYRNAIIRQFREKLENGDAALSDIHGYAQGLGESASAALNEVIRPGVLPDDRFYFNIADRTVRPLLVEDFNAVQDAASEVQRVIDRKEGIGLNSVRAKFPEDRAAGLIDKLAGSKDFDEIRRWLGGPVQNLVESYADDWMRANAESRYKAGMSPVVVRSAKSGCCTWCANLVGTYQYEDVRYGSNVWRRHLYCHCSVMFYNGEVRQSAWSRKTWQSSPEELARRRESGQVAFRMTPELLEEINDFVSQDREIARLMRENPNMTREQARYYGPKHEELLAKARARYHAKRDLTNANVSVIVEPNDERTYDTSQYPHNSDGTISVSRVVDRSLPKDAKPYEVIDVRTTKGTVNRTYFDGEGKRGQRIDSTDHGQPKWHPEGAHKHIMLYDENGVCTGDGKWIPLNDKDRRENADIL